MPSRCLFPFTLKSRSDRSAARKAVLDSFEYGVRPLGCLLLFLKTCVDGSENSETRRIKNDYTSKTSIASFTQ